jgi:serine acetyltransferase
MILGNIPIEDDVVVGAAAIVTVPVKQGETVVGINRVLSKEQKQSAEEAGRERETWMYDI